MAMLTLALFLGACAFLYVSWASWVGGFPPEVAVVRGVLGFMAVAVLGFIAELTVVTARASGAPASRAGTSGPVPLRPRLSAESEGTPEQMEDDAARAA